MVIKEKKEYSSPEFELSRFFFNSDVLKGSKLVEDPVDDAADRGEEVDL